MDLDSFTENLMQKTQARRDYLSKKLSEINQLSTRKRRTSDTDENSDVFEVDDAKQVDDSPKRQCLETSSEAEDETEYLGDEAVENKENLQAQNEHNNSLVVPIHAPGKTRGLAALRKSKLLNSEDNAICHFPKDEVMIGFDVSSRAVLTSKTKTSTNSRFAVLAANIRNWDDDTSNSSSYPSSVEVRTASYNREPTSVSSNASNSSDDSLSGSASSLVVPGRNTISNLTTNNNFKHVTFKLAKNSNHGDGQLVNSQSGSNSSNPGECILSPQKEPKQNLKSSKEEQQVRKVHVWDQAVLATLESQGFVKSSSKSKLSYDFSPKGKQPGTETKLPVIPEGNQDKKDECLASQKIACPPGVDISPIKAVSGVSLELKPCLKQNLSQNTIISSNITSADGSKDPAELPLSTRRALFESAFFGGAQKQIENTCESNLSVAQRAAIFEKAAKQGSMPSANKTAHRDPASPMKLNTVSLSPVKAGMMVEPRTVKNLVKPNLSTESKLPQNSTKHDSPNKIAGSPEKTQTLTSPLKNIGPHTLLMHERLSSRPGWQDKEIVVKAKEERKNEISALCSHWEKVSSSSADSNPESIIVRDADRRNPAPAISSSDEEKASPVFTEDVSSSLEEMPEDNSLEDNQYSHISSELEWDEEMASEKNESDEFGESEDLTGEAVVFCDKMDELLYEALDSQSKSSIPSSSPEKVQQKWQGSDTSISNKSSLDNDNLSSTPKCFIAVPVCSSESNTKTPVLQYTVSTYRKQKQEAKMTPVRTIKREPSINPLSPKVENRISVKEEIQALHNEVLTQQNHISQTSQALNLCRATAEFSGSTEEVEGEKLLLIATLKRQSCLNEIQRLKTLGHESTEDRKGTLTINDIRLPLKRDFIASQLEGKDNVVHYFLCSIRHRAQVVFTQMVSSKDGVSGGCLNFTNHINIRNLPADFSVAFEVYTLNRNQQVLPHEKKYHIKKDHNKLRLTPKGKKGDSKLLTPAVSSPGGPMAVRTPSFYIVGFTRFTIKNCDRKNCTLEKVPFSSPLEGSLHFNVQLHAEHNISMTGFLTMFEDVSGFGAWHRRWCVLDGGDLAFWKYPDEEKKKEPIGIIDLTQCVTAEVGLVSRDICARPHTFQLVTVRPHEKGDKNTLISRSVNTLTTTKHLLSADTKPERIVWCQKLNDALTNVRKWNPHALRPVELRKDN